VVELDRRARIGSSWADHSAIADAIVHGSPLQAALLMDEHIEKGELRYRQKLAQDLDENLIVYEDEFLARPWPGVRDVLRHGNKLTSGRQLTSDLQDHRRAVSAMRRAGRSLAV
jgi:hypothetical protein